MKHSTTRRLTMAVATMAASLLVAATAAAEGGVRPDDQAMHGMGAIALKTTVVRPDDRATRGPGSLPSATFVEPPAAGAFDWADAGVGAAAVVGLGLIGFGAFVIVARNRRGPAFS